MSRVTELRYVAFGVADLAAERAFYTDAWGLKEVAEQDGAVYLAGEGDPNLFCIRLRATTEKCTDAVGLAADTDADVDALHAKVVAAGCRIIFAPQKLTGFGGGYGFRFFSPDGLPFEISSGVAPGTPRPVQRWEAVPVKLSHIGLHSPNHKAAAQFFIDVLGFQLTDWIGEFMVFLRCNQWHHRIAVLPGPACINHVSFDMLGIDDMVRASSRMQKLGYVTPWGPGRHVVGDNTFCYFHTPAGFMLEYTAELELIGENHQPRIYTSNLEEHERWGIATGSPRGTVQTQADKGLFVAAAM